jgi:hypothetical protein
MPAKSLSRREELAHAFCVVGTYCNAKDKYVRHVGLLSPSRNGSTTPVKLSYGQAVSLDHVFIEKFEPLYTIIKLNHNATAQGVAAHVVGWLNGNLDDDLSPKQKEKLMSLIGELETARIEYVCHPPCPDFIEPNSMGHLVRMSCVGLVILVYKSLGTQLLDESYSMYPNVSKKELESIYPMIRGIRTPEKKRKIGLIPPDGPWPIVLPSYLFHALNSDAQNFLPKDAHKTFT